MKYSIDLPMLVLSTLSVMTCLACKTPAEKSQVATAEMDNEFVRINPLQKTKLLYKGREYRFSAANSYSMLKSRDAADQQFTTMKEMGVNALRMWGFWNGSPESLQPSRGVYNEATWQQLDYVLAQAEERGIKIIMPLANYWDEFGGIVLLNSWAGHPPEQKEYYDREIFYVNANSKQLYRDYVIHMLNRRNTITGRLYKNDPTILMWEPMNEARGRSDSSGQTVAEWLAWASQIIKAEDPHHLIGSGTEGFFKTHANFTSYPWQAAHPKPAVGPKGQVETLLPEGSYFHLDCKIASIDLCSIHAWPYQWFIGPNEKPEDFMAHWIEEHLNFMSSSPEYEKPLYLAEFGWQLYRKDGNEALEQRRLVFEKSYFNSDASQKSLRKGLAGIGFWNISEVSDPDPNWLSFDVLCPKDGAICSLIKEFSEAQR